MGIVPGTAQRRASNLAPVQSRASLRQRGLLWHCAHRRPDKGISHSLEVDGPGVGCFVSTQCVRCPLLAVWNATRLQSKADSTRRPIFCVGNANDIGNVTHQRHISIRSRHSHDSDARRLGIDRGISSGDTVLASFTAGNGRRVGARRKSLTEVPPDGSPTGSPSFDGWPLIASFSRFPAGLTRRHLRHYMLGPARAIPIPLGVWADRVSPCRSVGRGPVCLSSRSQDQHACRT